jgi:hypothetical protein
MSTTKKTYICGCVKNCGQYIEAVLKNIEKLIPLFADYQIVIAFDISQDQSLRILCEQKRKYKIDILINRNPVSIYRTENISNARNSILKYIRDKNDPTFEHFIMLDFDDVCAGTIHPEVLQRYLGDSGPEWDSLSFRRKIYYDAWALSIEPYVFSCWHFNNGRQVVEMMQKYIDEKLDAVKPGELLECMSAFNGFAIYKTEKFIDQWYEWDVHKNLEIIPKKLIIKNIEAVGRELIRHYNNDQDCEHRFFHIRAIQRNGTKIRIAPECLFSDIQS